MQKADFIRLRHMLDAAKESVLFAQNQNRSSLDSDRKLILSIVKDIEIVGEAASQITQESKKQLPQIPWPSIIGMRNRLIHAYFDIDLDVVWITVTEDIPPLIEELEKIIQREIQS